MKARFAVMLVLGVVLTEGCRRAETPAPSPSPTAAVALPTPSPTATPAPSPAAPSPAAGPPRPVARHRAGARPLPGSLRDHEGSVRRRGDARVGAPRGRPLLQPRAGRLLRRRRLLPRDRRVHGPVRHQRRPPGQRRMAGGPHPRRPGHPVESAGDGDLRHGRARTRGPPSSSSTSGTTRASTVRGSPPSAAWWRALPSWTRCTPGTGRALPAEWAPTRGVPRPRATPTCGGRSRRWTSSRPPAW